MPFIPVPEGVEVIVKSSLFGQEIINTLWFTEAGVGPFTLTALQDIAVAVRTAWRTHVLPLLSHDLVYVSTQATDMTAPGGLQYVDIVATGDVGSMIGPAAPGNVAFCVSFKTGHTGRSFRGRNYLAGIDSTEISGNTVSMAHATAFAAAYTSLFNELAATDVYGVVVSKFSGGVARVTAVPTRITTVQAVDNVLDSQRRRLTGRGI